MNHNIVWSRKPYYKFDNLKSINIDYENKVLDIVLFVNDKKEYTYRIASNSIKSIKFCVGYNKSMDKSVFIVISYQKNEKENKLSFYLPRKHNEELVYDIQKFAQNFNILFEIGKGLNPLIFIIIMMLLWCIVRYFLIKK